MDDHDFFNQDAADLDTSSSVEGSPLADREQRAQLMAAPQGAASNSSAKDVVETSETHVDYVNTRANLRPVPATELTASLAKIKNHAANGAMGPCTPTKITTHKSITAAPRKERKKETKRMTVKTTTGMIFKTVPTSSNRFPSSPLGCKAASIPTGLDKALPKPAKKLMVEPASLSSGSDQGYQTPHQQREVDVFDSDGHASGDAQDSGDGKGSRHARNSFRRNSDGGLSLDSKHSSAEDHLHVMEPKNRAVVQEKGKGKRFVDTEKTELERELGQKEEGKMKSNAEARNTFLGLESTQIGRWLQLDRLHWLLSSYSSWQAALIVMSSAILLWLIVSTAANFLAIVVVWLLKASRWSYYGLKSRFCSKMFGLALSQSANLGQIWRETGWICKLRAAFNGLPRSETASCAGMVVSAAVERSDGHTSTLPVAASLATAGVSLAVVTSLLTPGSVTTSAPEPVITTPIPTRDSSVGEQGIAKDDIPSQCVSVYASLMLKVSKHRSRSLAMKATQGRSWRSGNRSSKLLSQQEAKEEVRLVLKAAEKHPECFTQQLEEYVVG